MDDLRENLRIAVDELIGDGRKFASGRELAQRAHTLGLVESADSFARTVNRVRSGDKDVQLSTVDIIARTAGKSAVELIARGKRNRDVERTAPELKNSGTAQSRDTAAILGASTAASRVIQALLVADKDGMPSRAFDSLLNTLKAFEFLRGLPADRFLDLNAPDPEAD